MKLEVIQPIAIVPPPSGYVLHLSPEEAQGLKDFLVGHHKCYCHAPLICNLIDCLGKYIATDFTSDYFVKGDK